MILEYKINEEDYLEFQLFTASKSERINKKKRNGWTLLTIGSVVGAFYFYWSQNVGVAIYLGVLAIVCGLFYPKYFKWRYKKHYESHIKENFSKRFGQIALLEINNDSIYSKDKIGEGKINLSEVEKINETSGHFFVKLSSGHSLIIPKKELTEIDDLRGKFKELGLPVNDESNWTWK